MKKANIKRLSNNWKYLLPISLTVFLIPLIVYMKVVTLTPIEIAYWKGRVESPDFFSYYKMIGLNIFTILGTIFTYFYFKNTNSTIKKTNIYIPMIVYSLLILLSTLLAEHKSVAVWGFVDRYEGMFVLLSYLVIMFITINIVKDEKSIKVIIYPLLASATIIGIIGVFQYLGHDFFQTNLGKKIILPSHYKSLADNLKFNFGKNTIYSTLYNTNYVGSYMAMIFPLTLILLTFSKDIWKKLKLLPLSLLMFLNLIGSNSRGGIFGTVIALIIFLIFIRKQILKNWKIVVISLIILSVSIASVNKISNGRLTNQITGLKNDIVKLIGKGETENLDVYKVKEVSVKDNILKIETTKETLKIINNRGQISFLDGDDTIVESEYNSETGEIQLSDERYSGYDLKIVSDGKNIILSLNLDRYISNFVLTEETFKYYRGLDVFKEIKEIPHYGFEGKETLGSGRGYIWSRTLPMLKENLIIGKGPDTYAIYFPQEDFKGRFNIKMFANSEIVDKPHNLYLQIATNTGVISLLTFLSIVLMYLYKSAKIYFKNTLESELEIFGIGLFIAVIGYLVTGIFNDSVVSVAPVFFAIMGTGVAVNLEIEKLAHKI